MATQFDLKTDQVVELANWLKERTASVNEGVALLVATIVVVSESHLTPKPTREDIVRWTTDAIRGLKMSVDVIAQPELSRMN